MRNLTIPEFYMNNIQLRRTRAGNKVNHDTERETRTTDGAVITDTEEDLKRKLYMPST